MATRDEDAREAIVPALVQIGEQLSDLAVLARDLGVVSDSTDPHAISLLYLSIILGSTIIRALDLPRADTDRVDDLLLRMRGTTT